MKYGDLDLRNMDCMELMKAAPDNHWDLAIVDPPYGIKEDGHRENNRSKLAKSTKFHKALWDQMAPEENYFRELERVSKNQIVWGGNHLSGRIQRDSPCWIVWDKHTTGGFADCELAYTSFSSSVRKFDYPWNGMIQGFHGSKSKNQKRIHPTQKPIELYNWILHKYAKEGDRILDTHLGSGSIAIACYYMGFDLTGAELDPDYYAAMMDRIARETRQQELGL